jgi:DNA-binding PadR family transcriptional regulator
MNRYPFIKIIIINCLMRSDGLSGYDIIKFCRDGGIPASSGTVYPHLKSLTDAGYVACEEDGRRKLYSLTPKGREEMEGSGLINAPDFLKNAYFKSIALASNMDWSSRDDVRTLMDNVDEIKKYLSDYMSQLP